MDFCLLVRCLNIWSIYMSLYLLVSWSNIHLLIGWISLKLVQNMSRNVQKVSIWLGLPYDVASKASKPSAGASWQRLAVGRPISASSYKMIYDGQRNLKEYFFSLQRPSYIGGHHHLSLKIIFHWRSSSIEGFLP